ncbi:hypothetical protein [Ruminococcus sp.]|uniref:hypothetical protein n=1 Tax=Ruminococcus sp. TaxID=41978 RepID=UPI0025D2DEAC|nr:hypothetical protein [Ruminococcus sp.]
MRKEKAMNSSKYDQVKYSKALRFAALRFIVAVYICYLAFKIASADDTTMSKTLCWIIGGVFIAAAIGFGVYSYKRFHADLDDAKLKEEDTIEAVAEEADAEDSDADSDISVNKNI